MLDYFNLLDHQLFDFIQINFRSVHLDPMFLAFRDKVFWIPFYIFLTSWIIIKFRNKAWRFFALMILTIILTDQLNSTLLKKHFERVRPCNEIYFKDQFLPVIECSGGFSFPSSHATNHMGIASLLFFVFGSYFGSWKWGILVWALLVGFSQVYIGVHFPFDVLAGWIEGFLVGFGIFVLFRKFILSP